MTDFFVMFDDTVEDDRWHYVPNEIQMGGQFTQSIILAKVDSTSENCLCPISSSVRASQMTFDKYGIPYDPRNSWSE